MSDTAPKVSPDTRRTNGALREPLGYGEVRRDARLTPNVERPERRTVGLVRELARLHTSTAYTLELLAQALADESSGDDAPYSSIALPPDCPTRERFRRLAKSVHDARGDAAAWKRGRTWFVTRDAWSALRGGACVAKRASASVVESDSVDAADALRRAGLRVIGGAK